MRDLSLHILNLIENSIHAEASVISVRIIEKPQQDMLRIVVEDNGPGLPISPEAAMDPFRTTKDKKGKQTGLGLSLLRAAAEQAGGRLTLSKSRLGGLAVEATMQISHTDRTPLGDLAATLASVVCTNPQLDLRCQCCVGDKECTVRVSDVAQELPADERRGLAIARRVCEKLRAGLKAVEILA